MRNGCRQQQTISSQLPPNCLEVRHGLPFSFIFSCVVRPKLTIFNSVHSFGMCPSMWLVPLLFSVFFNIIISVFRNRSSLSVFQYQFHALIRFPERRCSVQLYYLPVWLLWIPPRLSRCVFVICQTYWITDTVTSHILNRKNCELIQTWHILT